jgi:hypothetical protein
MATGVAVRRTFYALLLSSGGWLSLVDAMGGGGCNSHSSCQQNFYCDSGGSCYTCSYITPVRCDAMGGDCCAEDFLAQCTDNPAQCVITPSPEPGDGDGGAGAGDGGRGWMVVVILCCSPAACASQSHPLHQPATDFLSVRATREP